MPEGQAVQPVDRELELDCLKEFANLGLGKVAERLGSLVGIIPQLQIPSAEIIARRTVGNRLGLSNSARIVGVRRRIEGAFEGTAILLLDETKFARLLGDLEGHAAASEDGIDPVSRQFLFDISSIVVGGILSTMSDLLSIRLSEAAPRYARDGIGDIVGGWIADGDGDDPVLYLQIGFTIGEGTAAGLVIMLHDAQAMKSIFNFVNQYLESDAL